MTLHSMGVEKPSLVISVAMAMVGNVNYMLGVDSRVRLINVCSKTSSVPGLCT